MCFSTWELEIRYSSNRIDNLLRGMKAKDKANLYDVFYSVFCKAYALSDDWPSLYTRVDEFKYFLRADLVFDLVARTEMKVYTRSRGFRGLHLHRPEATHVVRTVLHMTSVRFREQITSILSECIQIYGDRLSLAVLKCPKTWLFIESAQGVLQQCTNGRIPSSGALMHLGMILPSKADWCELSHCLKLKIGSKEANSHKWCWYRLTYLFRDFVELSNAWKIDLHYENVMLSRSASDP